mmetsp:Transcript_16502/g.55057  ORF Transcript_16502/g.55057 Transcript_16502/m.55057 type:complete len:199 (+) Transcript_16502:580-1176(+)
MVKLLVKLGVDKNWRDSYGDLPIDKALRNAQQRFPSLPVRAPPSFNTTEKKEVYYEVAKYLNDGKDTDEVPSEDRFSIYAPILPGRIHSYDVGINFTELKGGYFDSSLPIIRDNLTEWRDHEAGDVDGLELDYKQIVAQNLRQENNTDILRWAEELDKEETVPPPTARMEGILDEFVEDLKARWKDPEYEKRMQGELT